MAVTLAYHHYMAIRLVALDIYCGFARTAIQELTPCTKGPNKQKNKLPSSKNCLHNAKSMVLMSLTLRAVDVMVHV